jgi:hypothetical protein
MDAPARLQRGSCGAAASIARSRSRCAAIAYAAFPPDAGRLPELSRDRQVVWRRRFAARPQGRPPAHRRARVRARTWTPCAPSWAARRCARAQRPARSPGVRLCSHRGTRRRHLHRRALPRERSPCLQIRPLSSPPGCANAAAEPKRCGIIIRVSGVRVPPPASAVQASAPSGSTASMRRTLAVADLDAGRGCVRDLRLGDDTDPAVRIPQSVAPHRAATQRRETTAARRLSNEAEQLLAALQPEDARPYAIALYAGLRRSEIHRLEWSDLLDGRTIASRLLVTRSKTDAGRGPAADSPAEENGRDHNRVRRHRSERDRHGMTAGT